MLTSPSRIGLPTRARHRLRRPRRSLRAALVVVLSLLSSTALLGLSPGNSNALFTSAKTVGANVLTTTTVGAPLNLTVTKVANGLQLSWTASTSAFVDGYKVLSASTSGGTYTEIATVTGVNNVSYVDTTAPQGATFYKVYAYRINWTSPVTGPTGGSIPLPAPTNFTHSETNTYPTQASVSWSAVTNAASYNVYMNRCQETVNVESAAAVTCTNAGVVLKANTIGLSYTIDEGVQGAWYHFTVAAVDARGVEGASTSQAVSPTIPAWPAFAAFTQVVGNYGGFYEHIEVRHASTSTSMSIERKVDTGTWASYVNTAHCNWYGQGGGGGDGTAYWCGADGMPGWTQPKMGHDYYFRGIGCDAAGCSTSASGTAQRIPYWYGISADLNQYGNWWYARANYGSDGAVLAPDDYSVTRLASAPSTYPNLYSTTECPPYRPCTNNDKSVLLKAPVAYPANCSNVSLTCHDGDIFTNDGFHAIPSGTAARTWEFWYKQYGTWGAGRGWFGEGNNTTASGWGMKSGTSSTQLQWIDGTAFAGTAHYADGNWHLYDITFNGSSTVTLYEDGVSLGSITKAINTVITPYPANQVTLGTNFALPTGMAGWYDEWATYKAALPPSAITEHWNGRADAAEGEGR